jgi:sucrose-phosphate synthase
MRILFINPQGNFDQNDSYLTQHPDFGGQLVYTKETACSMAKLGHEVDIITRRIIDNNWKGFEKEIDYYSGVKNLRIIRIPFGGDAFLNKESLWPHIREFVDGIISFYKREGVTIDFITSHYGDGGIAAAMLSERLNVPFSLTGHSLGAQKLDKMHTTEQTIYSINEKYHFNIRLAAERIAMNRASVIFVSTMQERLVQYSHPAYKDIVDSKDDSKFRVVPPGVNTTIFQVNSNNDDQSFISKVENIFKRDISAERSNLPFIVASSRLEPKKNHKGIIQAYASNKSLQAKSNLAIVVRGLDNPFVDYSYMREGERKILDIIMGYVYEFNLKGKISFIDVPGQIFLSSLYRYLAKRRSLFCLTALYEPFGLAPLEAMACGLPAVVTRNGGPMDIFIEDSEYFGCLVDPEDHIDIANGLNTIFKDWEYYQRQGIKRVYSKYTWDNTAKQYLDTIEEKIIEFKQNSLDTYFKNIENFQEHLSVEDLKKHFCVPVMS